MDRETFDRQVRDALGHLYDTVHLRDHPLTAIFCFDLPPGAIGQAQVLRRVLLEAIERLRPDEQVPYSDREWRPYRVLLHRHVQRMAMLDTMNELAISERQYQREHARALSCVGDWLWAQVDLGESARAAKSARQDQVGEELSRLLSGALQEALDVNDILAGAVNAVVGLADAHAVEIHMAPAPTLDYVHGDRGVLRQTLLSILTYLISRGEGDELHIVMSGDASGMTIRFARTPRGLAREGCRVSALAPRLDLGDRLAQSMGGRLDSDGNEICLFLPYQHHVIMVVDDNRDVIELIERYLGDGRYTVVGASSGETALKLAAEIDPELILLDVMMPARDGWEVLQALKHSPDTLHIPVVICSILDERELAFSLGADGFLRKPVTQSALLDLLLQQVSESRSPGPA